MVDVFNFSLSPMTTCKLISILHHSNTDLYSLKCTKISRIITYIQSRCRFLNAHPRKMLINQDPSSYILIFIIPGVLNTFRFLSFFTFQSLPLQAFHGPYRKFQPADSLICISYIQFVVAIYIKLMGFSCFICLTGPSSHVHN